jgi:poly-gamma-glutamate synthesis protein (capsule biosynthesis protein)
MQVAKIAAVGDICPGDHYFSLGHGAGCLDGEGRKLALKGLSRVLRGADIAIANLEGVLSSTSNVLDPIESRIFRGPTEWASALREVGFTAMNVANNHTLQHGEEAFWNTVHACEEAGLDVVGLAGDGGLPQPVYRRFGQTQIALLGASFVPDPRRPAVATYAHPDLATLAQQVRAITEAGSFVVVSAHIGEEARWLPDQATMDAIDALSAAGARAVLVHHSHVFHPVFRRGPAVVASGLGDCLFDLHWHDALTHTAIVTFELHTDSATDITLSPFRLTRDMKLQELVGHRRSRFFRDLELRGASLDYGRMSSHRELRWLQIRKAIYFLRNLVHGDTRGKLKFLSKKAKRLAGRPA